MSLYKQRSHIIHIIIIIFNGNFVFIYNIYRTLKDGYESDSTLVYRKHHYTPCASPSPQAKALYTQVQKGGEVPLQGLRMQAPEKKGRKIQIDSNFCMLYEFVSVYYFYTLFLVLSLHCTSYCQLFPFKGKSKYSLHCDNILKILWKVKNIMHDEFIKWLWKKNLHNWLSWLQFIMEQDPGVAPADLWTAIL